MVAVSGLIHVYGPPGAGKTLFALTAGTDPKKIQFIDSDASKGKQIAKDYSIPAGNYHDMKVLGMGLAEVAYYDKVMSVINKMPNDNEVLIWDNPIEFFKAAHSHVATNRLLWRKKWAPKGDIAGSQEWIVTRQVLLPRLYSLLQQKAELVILCTHEKPQRDDTQIKTGFMEPNDDPSLRTEAALVIRLARNTRNPEDPAPVGLVIKNIGRADPKTRSIIRILHDRIEPCTWPVIEDYLKNPVGSRTLEAREKPDQFEYNLIQGTLNPEQKELYEFRRKMALLKADETLSDDILSLAATYADLPPAILPNKIVAELQEGYPEITTEQVRAVLAKAAEVEEDVVS